MISFLYPWALVGLAAATVPILLHLFHRRQPPTVVFPAIRYLVDATRQHHRRLKLRNLLLLLLRTAMIVVLVLAAAAPSLPIAGVPGHVPTALVVILDNSASSSAVVDGVPRLDSLKAAALAVLDKATPDDAIWLLLADGVPRRGSPSSLRDLVRQAQADERRMDLGAALTVADDVVSTDSRPREIVLISDLQASALSPAQPSAPLVVARPASDPPANAGIALVDPGHQPWLPQGGHLVVAAAGDSGRAVLVTLEIGDRPPLPILVEPPSPSEIRVPGMRAGWWPLRAALDADEFRLDDTYVMAVRVAPPAAVSWDQRDRYLALACEVLAEGGRIRPAGGRVGEVTLGRLGGRGASVVVPPADAAEVGALNRALARRGVGWRFGAAVERMERVDTNPLVSSAKVSRRYVLEPVGSGRTGVHLSVSGDPWLVRSGDVVLIASRLDPDWTDLVVSADFVPFLDRVLNQIVQGDVALIHTSPGEPVGLPDVVTEIRGVDATWPVEGGAMYRPAKQGLSYLLAGSDTVGALAVNGDPRESRLARASDRQVDRLWNPTAIVGLDRAGPRAFAAGARSDLRGPLLWLAVLLGVTEIVLAGAGRRRQ